MKNKEDSLLYKSRQHLVICIQRIYSIEILNPKIYCSGKMVTLKLDLLFVGYLFVADFGLAKLVTKNELANSFCGTAEYLSPEMLIGSGHDYTVDWWALGILLYEMLVGIPPFFHRNKHRMYFLIKESPVNFPDPIKHGIEVSPNAKDLIKKLLEKNRKKRLGAHDDVREILAHPFFEGVDIE